MNRRDFLITGGALACGPLAGQSPGAISLVVRDTDPTVQWAASVLQQALSDAGHTVHRQSVAGTFRIIASLAAEGGTAESLSIAPTRNGILASGADARGLSYALLELADRASGSLRFFQPAVEKPANAVRSVMRQFTCEPLDKPWFHDREMWPHYLTMLATQRFNRFHLAFGLGYDSLQNVADSYVLFLYPFLLSVPGYDVRATNLADAERDRNLEALRFISEQTVARGMDFQLGIWMHGYRWPSGPRVQNNIEGLNDANHAPYCRDALTALLRACPAISSVALRIHGESGIAEGSYDFWRTVFDGVKRCGRKVEIDLHSKGVNATMIASAQATGMPVNVAPKYWAEHLGMPYHQAAIRDLEMPVDGHSGAGLMTLSEGALVFTRYGYADFLRDDRNYTVRHRVFSGTQRVLSWGDPTAAAAYSRMFQFCGSSGVDLMEPLTCRGRRGSGVAGSRIGYADKGLEPRWDWEKYKYWYRVWGRMLYNPSTAADVFERESGSNPKSKALQASLAKASRILPIITTAHLPSAACDAYWPEIYWNQPMIAEPKPNPYGDSPAPKTFTNVSPLDPRMFSRMTDFADELLQGKPGAKYSPLEVASWLEDFADGAGKSLAQAGTLDTPKQRRVAIDVDIQTGLGRFFAAKFRSGVLFAIFERTGDRHALEEALKAYRAARLAWAGVADRAKGVYVADVSSSDRFSARGNWMDRLPLIDQDIARMEALLATAKTVADPRVNGVVDGLLQRPRREPAGARHRPPGGFRPGQAVALELAMGKKLQSARLYYRHVNQAEQYQLAEMEFRGNLYHSVIPALYTDSPYPLQYYFELTTATSALLYPGFPKTLDAQPYFVLQRIGHLER